MNEALTEFNNAQNLSNKISSIELMESQSKDIKENVKITELKVLIKDSYALIEKGDHDAAIRSFNRASENAKTLYGRDVENEDINNIDRYR